MNALEAYSEHRSLLFSIAYRMLGSVQDAEDVLQDAYLRWRQTDMETVRSARAYLVSIVTRLAIDQLRSARVRREVYVGTWLPEPLFEGEGHDAREKSDLADTLSTAFLVVLENLSPAERAAFLLREVFDLDYGSIAEVLERTEANCRQIVKRARDRVALRRPHPVSSPEEDSELVARLVSATLARDVEGMKELLAGDAAFHTDHGGKAPAAQRTIHGADKIARFILGIQERFSAPEGETRVCMVNGRPGIVETVGGTITTAITFEIVNGKIQSLFAVRNPDKLKGARKPNASPDSLEG